MIQSAADQKAAAAAVQPIERRALSAPAAMCEAYHYSRPVTFSRGMEVRLPGAKLVFVSGTASVGEDGRSLFPGDFRAQARRAFENAAAVLADAGASWREVVKVTIYIRDIGRDYAAFNDVRAEFFKDANLAVFPASTCVEAHLCREDLLVEMEMLAVVGERG
jgi:enamine deaminase RidA (YjgF/YER057c/UK114 family)